MSVTVKYMWVFCPTHFWIKIVEYSCDIIRCDASFPIKLIQEFVAIIAQIQIAFDRVELFSAKLGQSIGQDLGQVDPTISFL